MQDYQTELQNKDIAGVWMRAYGYMSSLKPAIGDVVSNDGEEYISDYQGTMAILELIRQLALQPDRMKEFFQSPIDVYAVDWKKKHKEFLNALSNTENK